MAYICQETCLEPKPFQNSCLVTVAVATEIFQNGRQMQFNHIYITNEFGGPQFFFIKSLHYKGFIDRNVLKNSVKGDLFYSKKHYFSSLKKSPITEF